MYCECGCGELTPLARSTQPSKGWVKGQPLRFVKGHRNRTARTGQSCEIDGCDRVQESHGLCHSHAEYLRRTGNRPTAPLYKLPATERFWAKVNKTETCWLWTGSTGGGGRYGGFGDGGRIVRAHRWAWEEANGPIPDGMTLDHLCRTTLCVRPDHLEPVTQRENVLRGEAPSAANARKTHCDYGHPLSGDNLIVRPGGRECRECVRRRGREAQRRYRERKKAG